MNREKMRSNDNNNNKLHSKRILPILMVIILIIIISSFLLLSSSVVVGRTSDGGVSSMIRNQKQLDDITHHDSNRSRRQHRRLMFGNTIANMFPFFFTDFCHQTTTDVNNTYENTKVFILFTWFHQLLHPTDIQGNCIDQCNDLCNHQSCMEDFSTTNDSTCTCYNDEEIISLCKSNSHCIEEDDKCECDSGFIITNNNPDNNPNIVDCTSMIDALVQIGGTETSASTEITNTGNGETYSVQYDLVATDDGIVTLGNIESYVTNIECSAITGIVRIQLDTNLASSTAATLTEMYPLGSILVVDHEKFGLCEDDETDDDSTSMSVDEKIQAASKKRAYELQDYYLRIEQVSGTTSDAIIQGTAVTFLDLFPQGSIDIQRIEQSSQRRLVPDDLELTFGINDETGAFEASIATPWIKFADDKVKVNARGTLKEAGHFEDFHTDWDDNGIDIFLNFTQDTEMVLDLTTTLSIAKIEDEDVYGGISIPIYGNPVKVDLGFGTIAFGQFFEIPLLMQVKVEIQKILEPKPKIVWKSGRYEHAYRLSGSSLFNLNFENLSKRYTNQTFDFTIDGFSDLFASTGNPTTLNVETFSGIRPQFATYIPFLDSPLLRASVDLGVGILIRLALTSLFKPIDTSENGFIYGDLQGACDQCHRTQLSSYAAVKNGGIFLHDKKEPLLPLGAQVTWKIMTACIFPSDDQTEQCSLDALEIPEDNSSAPCYEECSNAMACQQSCSGNPILITMCRENCLYRNSWVFSGCRRIDCTRLGFDLY